MKNKKTVISWFESEMCRERRVKHNIDMNHRTVLPSVCLSVCHIPSYMTGIAVNAKYDVKLHSHTSNLPSRDAIFTIFTAFSFI